MSSESETLGVSPIRDLIRELEVSVAKEEVIAAVHRRWFEAIPGRAKPPQRVRPAIRFTVEVERLDDKP